DCIRDFHVTGVQTCALPIYAKGLGQLITKTWVRDLDGNIVPANQADDTWYMRYEEAFNGNIDGVTPGNHAAARAFADQGMYLPEIGRASCRERVQGSRDTAT